MKKLFKGAIPTIALLLVAIMSLTGVTYAWFSVGQSATVDTVKVDVRSIDGLLVSSTGVNGTWGSYLTPKFDDKGTLAEVSTIGELDAAGKLMFYYAEYNADYDAIVKSTAVPATNEVGSYKGYISFPVYIKNDNDSAITVNLKDSTVTGTEFSKYAARIALVQENVASATETFVDGTYNYVSDVELLGIWEPNAELHTEDGALWLTNNNKTTGAETYKGLYEALNNGTQYEAGYWFINVANGEKYAIAATKDVKLSARQHTTTKDYYNVDNLPKGAEYYVYQANIPVVAGENDADHFKRLTINDYFAPIAFKDIAGLNGKLASDWNDKVYTYDSGNGEYVLVKANALVNTSTNYYILKDLTTDTREADKLVVFTYEKYQPISTAISLKDVANDGLTLADLAVGGKNVNEICAFAYLPTKDCYTPITMKLSDFFTKVTDANKINALKDGTAYIQDGGAYCLVAFNAKTDDVVAKTAAGQATYTKDLCNDATTIIRPGSVSINSTAFSGAVTVDPATGVISGGGISGSIDYMTGDLSITFATAPTEGGAEIAVDCEYASITATTDVYTLVSDVTAISEELYTVFANEADLVAAIADDDVDVYTVSDNKYTKVDDKSTISDTTAFASYYTKKAIYAEEYSAILKDIDTIQTTTTDSSNLKNFEFTVDANTISQLRVYIWLEGQDADCTNSVAGVPFNVDLKLNKKEETVTPNP